MKYLMKLLWLFLPREGEGDGDGNSGGDGDDNNNSGGDGDGSGDQRKPIGGDDPDAKPDWLADKFWNPDLKAPRTEVLSKSFNELEVKMRSKTEDLVKEMIEKQRADAPESYKVNLSDDIKVPENVELDLTDDDPLVKWFFGVAKEQGMTQETVDKMLNEYITIELANMPDVQAEIEKLGDHGQDRMLRVHNWLETKLSDTQFAAMNSTLSNAAQIEALEVLMKTAGPGDFDGDGGGQMLTLDELRAMQNDPRAYRDKDKAFLAKIEAGYKRLYKGTTKA